MKVDIKIMTLLSALILFTSCRDWLDLQPETSATEEQVFSNGEGYRSVLNGLYKSMASAELYGKELQFGMVDCISQQYVLTSDLNASEVYLAAGRFDYNNKDLLPVIESIWKAAYNVIANSNNLIQNIQVESPDLFAAGEMERELIWGEAYACRALVHFDLLRLFAPPTDDGRTYIPYVETYPNISANGITVNSFLDKVIADLLKARELVAKYDTTAAGAMVTASQDNRFNLKNDLSDLPDFELDDFFTGRGFRMSYYSITALLARVYQYAAKHADAFKMAEQVMTFESTSLTNTQYPFYSEDNFENMIDETDFEKKLDVKINSNLILAVYNRNAYQDYNLASHFKKKLNGGFDEKNYWFVINKKNVKIFNNAEGKDESTQDVRSHGMIFLAKKNPISVKWYCSDNTPIRDRNVTICPIIRATEMRYIMAECYAREGNYEQARDILDEIRKNRGCQASVPVMGSWESFVTELVRDARREWISEGQLFYLYKRLNADVDFGKGVVRPLQRSEYLLPVPSSQTL